MPARLRHCLALLLASAFMAMMIAATLPRDAHGAVSCSGTTMVASWYQRGHRTASGARFNPDGLTAAHRSLAFGTRLRLSFAGHAVTVTVNDRGPFIRGRHLDVSRGVARALGFQHRGVVRLCAKVLK